MNRSVLLLATLALVACAETQSIGGPDRGGNDSSGRPSRGDTGGRDDDDSDGDEEDSGPASDAGTDTDADEDVAVADVTTDVEDADPSDVSDVSDTSVEDTAAPDVEAPDVTSPDVSADTSTDAATDVAPDTAVPDTGTEDTGTPDVDPEPLCPTPGRRVLADLDGIVYQLPPAIATHLRGLGYTLVDYSILDDAEIETADVVIIASMNIHDLTTSGLRDFINGGGNVFVYATSLTVSCNFNPTLQATGIQLSCGSNNTGTLSLDTHPSTAGLTRGSIPFGSSNWRVFASGGSTTARVASTSAGDVAMASEIGCGRALVWAAPDIGESESATDFWTAALGWLTAAR